jgi:hypothetical protein
MNMNLKEEILGMLSGFWGEDEWTIEGLNMIKVYYRHVEKCHNETH